VNVQDETRDKIYTSRVIKASALIPDTKVLLSEWNLELAVDENLERARRLNIFGKASRKRIDDILRIFRQRYFDEPEVGAALVRLVQENAPSQWIDPLLYFYSAQNDRTLRDTVIEVLYPRHQGGVEEVPIEVVVRTIRTWVAEGKTTTAWGDQTIERVAQGVMATLRDFGVLEGTVRKRLTPIYLPVPAFALPALWLQQRARSGHRVLQSEEWQLFFLPVEGVERFFIEAHQQHLLAYYAAGSVIRIEFPVQSLEEYANVLVKSAG
jgi:hypothetical protein